MSVWILVVGRDFYCQLDGCVCLAGQMSMQVQVTVMDLITRASTSWRHNILSRVPLAYLLFGEDQKREASEWKLAHEAVERYVRIFTDTQCF
jgi:hypothetical protein